MIKQSLSIIEQATKDELEGLHQQIYDIQYRCGQRGHVFIPQTVAHIAICEVCRKDCGRYCEKSEHGFCERTYSSNGFASCKYCGRMM